MNVWDKLARRSLLYLAYAVESVFRPRKPQPFTLTITRQKRTAVGIVFTVSATLPPLPTDDVIKARKLKVATNGGEAVDVPVALDANTVDLGDFLVGATVTAALSHVDEADNEGPPRTAEIVVSDTVAPAIPGEFGLSVGAQKFIA